MERRQEAVLHIRPIGFKKSHSAHSRFPLINPKGVSSHPRGEAVKWPLSLSTHLDILPPSDGATKAYEVLRFIKSLSEGKGRAIPAEHAIFTTKQQEPRDVNK